LRKNCWYYIGYLNPVAHLMGLVDSFVGAVFVYGFFVAVELAFGFECFAADLAGYAVYVYTAYGFLMG
jgi:hypothetical protein